MRVRRHGTELTPLLRMALELGPMPFMEGDYTDEDLEFAWRLHGETIMGEWTLERCSRPWGWWRFEQGIEPRPNESGWCAAELAQRGALTEAEYAEIEERAEKAKDIIANGYPSGFTCTGGGRPYFHEHAEVETWERVQEVRR